MIISIHQPAYLPWLGYFDKIVRSDIFVFLDSVQYQKNSYQNRNKLRGPQGSFWLTVPTKSKGHMGSILRDTLIDDAQAWRTKHLKTIENNYKKATHFKECFPKFKELLSTSESNLAELCWHQLHFWLKEFNIKTKVVRSSEVPITSTKSDLVLDLCKHFCADRYLSGALGKNYLDEGSFGVAGITVTYQDYQHPVYPQLWGEFEPFLGIMDYWMNCGSCELKIMMKNSHGA